MIKKISSIFLLLVIVYVAFFPHFINGSINIELIFKNDVEDRQFLLFFEDLKVHPSRYPDESGWILINFDKRPLDISKPENMQYLLAKESNLPVGNYDKISLRIRSATLEINQSPVQLQVTGPISIQKSFSVSKESAKTLTLIFEINMENTVDFKRLDYEVMVQET